MDTRKAVKTYHRNLAIVLAVIVAIFAAIPLVVDKPYIINIFVLTFYMPTLSMAWNILGGITGQNSLGLAAYMGLGAYVCCLVVTKTGMNPWALLTDFRAVAAAGLRQSPHAPVQGIAAQRALRLAEAAIQRLGAQVNPKIVLSVFAAKFRAL